MHHATPLRHALLQCGKMVISQTFFRHFTSLWSSEVAHPSRGGVIPISEATRSITTLPWMGCQTSLTDGRCPFIPLVGEKSCESRVFFFAQELSQNFSLR